MSPQIKRQVSLLQIFFDFPLPRAAPATSIQDKDNSSERFGPLGSPALLWSIFAPCGKAEKLAKAQSPSSSEDVHVYKKQGLLSPPYALL